MKPAALPYSSRSARHAPQPSAPGKLQFRKLQLFERVDVHERLGLIKPDFRGAELVQNAPNRRMADRSGPCAILLAALHRHAQTSGCSPSSVLRERRLRLLRALENSHTPRRLATTAYRTAPSRSIRRGASRPTPARTTHPPEAHAQAGGIIQIRNTQGRRGFSVPATASPTAGARNKSATCAAIGRPASGTIALRPPMRAPAPPQRITPRTASCLTPCLCHDFASPSSRHQPGAPHEHRTCRSGYHRPWRRA